MSEKIKSYIESVKGFPQPGGRLNKKTETTDSKVTPVTRGSESKELDRIDYSVELGEIIYKLDALGDDAVADALIEIDMTHNPYGITTVDVSKKDWYFDITVDGVKQPYKIGQFTRQMFGSTKFTADDIKQFGKNYNLMKNGKPAIAGGGKIGKKAENTLEIPEFKYDPTNVRSTFISLVTRTYPHPSEEDVMKFLPKDQLTRDDHGNYYKIIGKSTTMFTSHLDTADRVISNTNLLIKKEDGDDIIYTDGSTILGADDKAGVAAMLYMIHHKIPGVYYFFVGEERGGIGSNALAYEFNKVDHIRGVTKCISFDRRNVHSIITFQMGQECCSNDFGNGLARELAKSGIKMGLDDGGVYTDSASFIDYIPECTNVSIGYMNEHTGRELQNISFLERLCPALLKVDWENLPVARRVGFDEYLIRKHRKFLDEFKDSKFSLEKTLDSKYGRSFINISMDEPNVDVVYDNMNILNTLLRKHKMDPNVLFDHDNLKIELI